MNTNYNDAYDDSLYDNYRYIEESTDDIPAYRRSFNPLEAYRITTKPCGNQEVKDAIGREFENWSCNEPVFIPAPTGSGKTDFIIKKLLPYLAEKYHTGFHSLANWGREGFSQKVLVLSNRIALNIQIKRRLVEEALRLLGVADDVKNMSNDYIDENCDFAYVTVLSYQGLLSECNHLRGDYTHVICDECHFFVSDALFNPYTASILRLITTKFQNSIRIYMSATMDDCIWQICNYELGSHGWNGEEDKIEFMMFAGLTFKYYDFTSDYSYLDISYFSEYSELMDIIKYSNDEKWLIFIDSKKTCEKLKLDVKDNHVIGVKEALDEKSIDGIMTASSESKKDENFLQMINEAKFPENTKVLITTSVLDNGVSFLDENLKNVVIEEIDKVKCLQMVGRVRKVNPDSRVHLYIKIVNGDDIEKRISSLIDQMNAYTAYDGAGYEVDETDELQQDDTCLSARRYFNNRYYNGEKSDFENAKHWFYRDAAKPECVRPNIIAYGLVDTLMSNYESILKEMKEYGHGLKYLAFQLSWFSKSKDNVYKEENDLALKRRNTAKTTFYEYLDTLRNKQISVKLKKEKQEFKLEFYEKYTAAFGLRRSRDGFNVDEIENKSQAEKNGYGKEIINEIFEVRKINLKVESDEGRKVEYWKIVEHEW